MLNLFLTLRPPCVKRTVKEVFSFCIYKEVLHTREILLISLHVQKMNNTRAKVKPQHRSFSKIIFLR